MKLVDNPQQETYYIAYNDSDEVSKYHKGCICQGGRLQTAKENLLTYTSKSEWEDKLEELEIDIPEEI